MGESSGPVVVNSPAGDRAVMGWEIRGSRLLLLFSVPVRDPTEKSQQTQAFKRCSPPGRARAFTPVQLPFGGA
jgi:hypothetical protein